MLLAQPDRHPYQDQSHLRHRSRRRPAVCYPETASFVCAFVAAAARWATDSAKRPIINLCVLIKARKKKKHEFFFQPDRR